jgi:phosphoglucosamine mutase
MNTIKMTGKSLSELAAEMQKFPQLLLNVKVTDKHKVAENEKGKSGHRRG